MSRTLHICTPTRGAISIPTFHFLKNYQTWGSRIGINSVLQYLESGSVAEAREKCLANVDEHLEMQPQDEHWILWLDDDMDPPTNAVAVLMATILTSEKTKNPIGILSGHYSRKQDYDYGSVFSPKTNHPMIPVIDYKPGEIVEVQSCGLGFALQRATWNRRLAKPRFGVTGEAGDLEDVNYMSDLRKVGCIPYLHSGVQIGHFEMEKTRTFFPYKMPPIRSSNGKREEVKV